MARYIDIHTHVFHPKIAHKAIAHLNEAYAITCTGDGTLVHLQEREKALGVETTVTLCAATTPMQVIPANNFAMELQRSNPDHVIAFGTFHPAYKQWEEELSRLQRNAIWGIKLHPDFQGFRLDDPHLVPILDACQERFIIEIHVGDKGPLSNLPSTPYMIAKLCRMFPKLTIIAAHFGGYQMWEHCLKGLPPADNLWIDTSSTSSYVPQEMLRQLIRQYPEDHLLFGSDWPLYDPLEEAKRFQHKSRYTDSQMERLFTNADTYLFQGKQLCEEQ